MMIPYKGRKSGSRRDYLPSKPKKWRFKVFVHAGVSRIIYDFLPYKSDDTFCDHLFTGEELFELCPKLCVKQSPNPATSVVYFHNFFTTLPLVHYLRNEFGIFSLGNSRTNRIPHCDTLADEKSLKKKTRISVVRWVDKTVALVYSYAYGYPVSSVNRYCKDTRENIDVACPYVVKKYNTHGMCRFGRYANRPLQDTPKNP
ncbi:hypothetical protein PR048_013582 [Dryococelus australis]|uniref:PiggyBac transposable element-derived protein domain-containing protein n=1 Tax=Dryococelus australis TaxID=614101 RepID=A0ABQ9HSL7_9NEOP|nr:hypothetical protein PR048_013582 [Dryococelus australis]